MQYLKCVAVPSTQPFPHSAATSLITIEEMYSAQVLDHFQNPRNAGEIKNADARVEIENPACGDVLELSARIGSGRIVEIRFRAKGCVAAMACASALTEMVAGKTVREARELRRQDLVEKVGGLPEASAHAGYLALDALQSLLKGR
jgi:nitrogen fixation NifU-like protein